MKHMTLILLTVFLFTLMLPLHGRTAVKIHKMVLIPGGTFRMGDHHDLGGREHGNDEVPIHSVQLDAFHIGAFEITNTQYCRFLNKALLNKAITLDSKGRVYDKNGKFLLCDTHKSDNACDIKWAAESFVVFKNRGRHPAVCIRWHGAVAYCNLMSRDAGYSPCYNTETWECDITKNGYRLPGEAEWEYAGRGGAVSPYRIFPWGDTADTARANWPNSGDPFEYGAYPGTTPVGFYNGDIRYKKDFNWPGKQMLFQTSSGANGYGLYDMSGNVWEWVNDWYSLGYYKNSPRKNPTGPKKGQAMKDGKPYRTLRGGSWYNGQWGHGRVSNRNPSYYRGPEDPFHRWYHIGFRVARTASASEALASAVVSHKTTRMDIPTGESTQTKPYISPDNRSQMRTGNRPQTQRTQADGSSKRQRTRRETSGNNQQRKGRFEEMDVDNSGFVTLDEMLAHETEKFNSRNTQSNIKGERSFSLDQYLEDEKRKFLEMDTNGDNQLSKEEVETSERRRGSEKGNRSNTKRGQAGNNGSNYDQRGQAGNNGSNYDQRGQAGNYESNYNQRGQAGNYESNYNQ
ncbi:MAG: SUMF1/EgtB/PvdO family nonheme iron enzyme, partial [bacterium]|nr:SUMF1/EgtB/PvdO family nonheme iron enzyme [bacterium]